MDVNENREFDSLVDDFIKEERNTTFNPFLATRIMAEIEKKQHLGVKQFSPGWKTVFVGLSLAVTIFAGILAGNLYKSENESSAIMLMNDQQMENFAFYNQIGDE